VVRGEAVLQLRSEKEPEDKAAARTIEVGEGWTRPGVPTLEVQSSPGQSRLFRRLLTGANSKGRALRGDMA
jgi:hypothetical protein